MRHKDLEQTPQLQRDGAKLASPLLAKRNSWLRPGRTLTHEVPEDLLPNNLPHVPAAKAREMHPARLRRRTHVIRPHPFGTDYQAPPRKGREQQAEAFAHKVTPTQPLLLLSTFQISIAKPALWEEVINMQNRMCAVAVLKRFGGGNLVTGWRS